MEIKPRTARPNIQRTGVTISKKKNIYKKSPLDRYKNTDNVLGRESLSTETRQLKVKKQRRKLFSSSKNKKDKIKGGKTRPAKVVEKE